MSHSVPRLLDGLGGHRILHKTHYRNLPLLAALGLTRRLTAAEVLKLRGRYPTNRTVERLELLRIQNTLIVVPGGLPEPEEKAKQVRQLTD